MAGFWVSAAVLMLLALLFLLVPLWREQRDGGAKGVSGPLVAIAVVPLSIGLYLGVTTFDARFADEVAGGESELAVQLDQLSARLASDPSDVTGWVLLGRSYFQFGDYGRARDALEQAYLRSEQPDNALKLAYAQSLLFTEEGAALTLGGDLVEEVLASSPRDLTALLWGGFVAVERNRPAEAVERWTALLATNPPAEIADLIRNQLTLLNAGTDTSAAPLATASGPVISIDVSVADEIDLDAFGPNARLFVIARGNDSPAPIAVSPHPLAALPGRFTLSDADAMIAGRSLAQYDEVTVIARVSGSGQALEQSGDAYAEAVVDLGADQTTVALVIDRVVP